MTRGEIVLRQRVFAPRAAVWASLTDPALMNEWSTARIELLDAGDRDRADGVGALRRVHLPGRGAARLTEVIVTSDPPNRLQYTVFRGVPALREHRGTIELTAAGHATEVRWTVVMRFAIPGFGVIARRLIGRELQFSLERLDDVVSRRPVELPAQRVVPPVDLEVLRAEAGRVLLEQRAIANRLAAAHDPKQWFARVYEFVTEEQLAFVDSGRADNPEWVLRLIPRFHVYYAANLLAFERGDPVEEPWRKAWSLAERARSANGVTKALLLGVAAHIEADLPRALAETYADAFADRCDYVYFRADYVRMADIFRRASDRLVGAMPRRYLPGWLHVSRALLPAELRDALMSRYYDVGRRRLEAFDAGRHQIRTGSDPSMTMSARRLANNPTVTTPGN